MLKAAKQAYDPFPVQYAGGPPPRLTLVVSELCKLSDLETIAVRTGMSDPHWFAPMPGKLRSILFNFFGFRTRNAFADAHLDALRGLAFRLRAARPAQIEDAVSQARQAGMSESCIRSVVGIVRA
ncbi:hypothetical protein [Sphingomonas sp. UYP23]